MQPNQNYHNQPETFNPKLYLKQETTNFNDDFGDEMMDNDMTPSASTEDHTTRHYQNQQQYSSKNNEYDIDMDDDEETKEEPSAGVSVPVENFRQASKTLQVGIGIQNVDPDYGYQHTQQHQFFTQESGGQQPRRYSDAQGPEYFNDIASKRATRQASIDTAIDLSAITDQARKSSWNRLMEQNLETISAEQFDANMRRLSDLEQERRSTASRHSGPKRKPSVKKLNIRVLVEGFECFQPIESTLPVIAQDGIEGYDLTNLVELSMEVYELDPKYGVQVDYWSNALQTYCICDNLFIHRASTTSKSSTMSRQQHLITEEDLTINSGGQCCLTLRFKNCTGNIIELDEKQHIVTNVELAQAQIALSIDSQFKNQRNRTVTQAIDMVLRQRTIAMGFYDFQIRRYVKPMTLEQAARNLDLRHQMLTGEDQHIEKKTLDDYYAHIRTGNDSKNPYNFSANQDDLVKCLRKHCLETKDMM